MLRRAVRSVFRLAERFMNSKGYRITWHPLSADEDEDHGLKIDVQLLFARLMLRKTDIFFVEIGSNDGVTNDPIYPFATRYGWRGVLVEPQAEIFSKLERNYAGVVGVSFVNAAIGAADGEQTFFKIRQTDDPDINAARFPTQLASLRKESVLSQTKFVPNVVDLVEEVRVPVLTFETLMRKAGADRVDILVIDTEGYDAPILRSIDIERFKPAIVQYEHHFMSKAEQMEFAGRFRDAGYRIAKDNLNTIACLKESFA
jgi:FkbM family methyltransferase